MSIYNIRIEPIKPTWWTWLKSFFVKQPTYHILSGNRRQRIKDLLK